MSQPQGTLYEIRWNEIFPWLILVRSLRVSVMVRVLALAFAGVLLTQWGWSAVDMVFTENSARLERLTDQNMLFGRTNFVPTADRRATTQSNQARTRARRYAGLTGTGSLVQGWLWLAQPFAEMIDREISWRRSLALLLSGSWTIVVWALFGGAISRISAVYLTRGETLGPIEALKSALTKWGATAGGPFVVLLSVAALALPLIIDGFLMRSDFLAMFAGIFWGLVLLWGLLLALVLLGLFLGWPLMWATVSVERTDAFDGVSRCFAYVSQRPLHLVFYLFVASLLGLLGGTVVHGIAYATVGVSEWTISWGAGSSRTAGLVTTSAEAAQANAGTLVSVGARGIQFWKWTLQAFVASYSVGYLWSASVGIYLLLRRHIDSTELEEITFDESDLPQQGLPELEPDESGVPQVGEKMKNDE